MKQERERGITIKSAAIQLEFLVKRELTTVGKQGRELKELYVGNLPSGTTQEDFLENLTSDLPGDGVEVVKFNAKRNFAVIRVVGADASRLLKKGIHVGSKALFVEEKNCDSMSQLVQACQEHGLDMPSIEATEVKAGEEYVGRATWAALGGVIIQAAGTSDTRKAARQLAACQCLQFLDVQLVDHKQPPLVSQEAVDTAVPLVVNLIDSPGHIEFNAEVTTALRVSDGALLVVDAVEGMAVQTEEVVRQALKEGVKIVLMINKVDRLLIEQQKSPDEVFSRMQEVVEEVNQFIAAHQPRSGCRLDQRVSFSDGSVCFGSGYFGWSCSIDSLLSAFKASDEEALRRHLAKRDNFIKRVLKPITQMHRASGVLPLLKKTSTDPVTMVQELLVKAGVTRSLFSKDEDPSVVTPSDLLRKAMMAWLPAADPLVAMLAKHVPSPVEAQLFRAERLYSGPTDDECGEGIRRCDPGAPALVYITKLLPSSAGPHSKGLLAFGRVFSGTVRPGDALRVISEGTEKESKCKVSQIKVFGIKNQTTTVQSASAGEIVALEGLGQVLSKPGTLTSSPSGLPLRPMEMSVMPVLKQSVKPKKKSDQTKMVAELKRIVDADSTAFLYKDNETEELILAAAGELHMEVLLSSLAEASGIEVELGTPVVAFRETARSDSVPVMAKSDNKHNRVFVKASPLPDEIVEAMTAGDLVGADLRALGRRLSDKNSNNGARIWAVGPDPLGVNDATDRPTCVLVDSSFGLQIPKDAKENMVAAFKQVARAGILVGCPLIGVRFDLVDAKFHQDSSHRRPHSVVPAAARAFTGAFLFASPGLSEPTYRITVSSSPNKLNPVFSVLGQRGGRVMDTSSSPSRETISAIIPVRSAGGIADTLRGATHGYANSALSYSGFQAVPEGEEPSIIREAREAKGLKADVPTAQDFIDKL